MGVGVGVAVGVDTGLGAACVASSSGSPAAQPAIVAVSNADTRARKILTYPPKIATRMATRRSAPSNPARVNRMRFPILTPALLVAGAGFAPFLAVVDFW